MSFIKALCTVCLKITWVKKLDTMCLTCTDELAAARRAQAIADWKEKGLLR